MDWVRLIEVLAKPLFPYFEGINRRYVRINDVVAIHACDDKYVLTDLNDDARLAARNNWIGDWELFRIADPNERFSESTRLLK